MKLTYSNLRVILAKLNISLSKTWDDEYRIYDREYPSETEAFVDCRDNDALTQVCWYTDRLLTADNPNTQKPEYKEFVAFYQAIDPQPTYREAMASTIEGTNIDGSSITSFSDDEPQDNWYSDGLL